MSSIRRKNHSCEQNQKKKNKTEGTTVALLCLASGPLPNAANSSDKSFDVPSEFVGGDQLFVPHEVPAM